MNMRQDNVTGNSEKIACGSMGDVSGHAWEGLWMPQPEHVEHVDGTLMLGMTCPTLCLCLVPSPALTLRPVCWSHQGEQ